MCNLYSFVAPVAPDFIYYFLFSHNSTLCLSLRAFFVTIYCPCHPHWTMNTQWEKMFLEQQLHAGHCVKCEKFLKMITSLRILTVLYFIHFEVYSHNPYCLFRVREWRRGRRRERERELTIKRGDVLYLHNCVF